MEDMAEVQQLWGCQGDDLKDPEADVRDGKGDVVADVLASRLLSVTDEVGLFVAPNLGRIRGRTKLSCF